MMETSPYYRYTLEEIKTNSFTDKQLLPVDNADESSFNVKTILNKRIKNKQNEYLVQYADKDRIWVTEENLLKDGLKPFIKEYEMKQLPE